MCHRHAQHLANAYHKVGSEDPTEFHNLTQYLCCMHYRAVMGPAVPCAVRVLERLT